MAVFSIKTSAALAVWDLAQRGHPRHVSFDVQLPPGPFYFYGSYMSRSKWTVAIYESDRNDTVHYIYVDLPSKHIRNSNVPCQCVAPDTQPCHLEQQKPTLRAQTSSHKPKIYEYFIGDRFIVQRIFTSKDVYLLDFWKPQDYTRVECNSVEKWSDSFKRIVIHCLKLIAK